MTEDIIIVEERYNASAFANEVFKTVKKYENQGFDVEVQYAPRDEVYSAMIIIYQPVE